MPSYFGTGKTTGNTSPNAPEKDKDETITGDWTFDKETDFEGAPVKNVHVRPNAHIAMSAIPNGDHAAIPVHIPDGKTLKVWMWGCRDETQSTPANLTVELFDETNSTSVASESTARNTGEPVNDGSSRVELEASGSAVDATLRLDNATGSELKAGAQFSYTVE